MEFSHSISVSSPLKHFYALFSQESIPLAEEPSSAEPAEPTETGEPAEQESEPAPTEEPMEMLTVSLTKKKGNLGRTNVMTLNCTLHGYICFEQLLGPKFS